MRNRLKYFIDRDESGDWFLIPVDKQDEWEAWLESDEDIPEFAEYIDNPSDVVFENPLVN